MSSKGWRPCKLWSRIENHLFRGTIEQHARLLIQDVAAGAGCADCKEISACCYRGCYFLCFL